MVDVEAVFTIGVLGGMSYLGLLVWFFTYTNFRDRTESRLSIVEEKVKVLQKR